jgi:predicted peptidase
LTELNKKVFGKITTKEIIGTIPPASETKKLLENEYRYLINELESRNKDDLKKLLKEQQIANKHINSRPGAMALAQDKIRLFTEYNQKYIQIINEKLLS